MVYDAEVDIFKQSAIMFTFRGCGGIAQLGERLVRIQKVRGSNPLISTI